MDTFAEGSELAMDLQYKKRAEDPKVTERNRQTVMAGIDKVSKGDADGWWAMFHEDAVFHEADCLPYGGAHKGLPAIKKAFETLSLVYAHTTAVFEEILAGGDMVIAYQTITARIKANNNKVVFKVAELFRFRDGKVIEWRAHYFDSNLVASAINGTGIYAKPAA